MPKTPQDFGGPLLEDEIRFYDQYGVFPFGQGGLVYSDGDFLMEDQYGVFNPRFGLDPDETQIVYVGKHGDDGNDGLTTGKAKLTFGAAVSLANSLGPAAATPVVVHCVDAGRYQENLLQPSPHVHIRASAATLYDTTGNTMVALDADTSVVFHEVFKDAPSGGGVAVSLTQTPGEAYFRANIVRVGDICTGIQLGNTNPPDSRLLVEVDQFFIEDGVGISCVFEPGSESQARVGAIDISGTGIGVQTWVFAGTVDIRVGHIVDAGAGTAVKVNAGIVNANIQHIDCSVAYDVAATTTLNMFVNSISGSQINNGTVRFTRTGHGVIGDHLKDGYDEMDGDKLDIDFAPAYYSPDISPAEVDDYDHLGAHLAGIDGYFGDLSDQDAYLQGEITDLNNDFLSHAPRHLGSGDDSFYVVSLNSPTINEDVNDGYDIGLRWIDTIDGYEFVLVDNTAGAAVWLNTTLAGGGGSGPDELVRVSSNDTTTDYLINKIVSGTGINVTELNDGGLETLEISDDGYLQGELTNLNSDSITADAYLQGEITNLNSDSITADAYLQSEITGLNSDSITADAYLQSEITGLNSDSITADAYLQGEVTNLNSDSITADAYLQGEVTNLNSDFLSHADRHILGGDDEIDGDQLDVDFTPSFYSPTIDPPEVDNYDHLTSHLAGIDAYFQFVLSGGGVEQILDISEIQSTTTLTTTSTSPQDAFSGSSLSPNENGDYLAIFEADLRVTNNNGIMAIGIGLNGINEQSGSERLFEGNDRGSNISIFRLNGVGLGDTIHGVFRKNSGPGTAQIRNRSITIMRIA